MARPKQRSIYTGTIERLFRHVNEPFDRHFNIGVFQSKKCSSALILLFFFNLQKPNYGFQIQKKFSFLFYSLFFTSPTKSFPPDKFTIFVSFSQKKKTSSKWKISGKKTFNKIKILSLRKKFWIFTEFQKQNIKIYVSNLFFSKICFFFSEKKKFFIKR